ncbi:MAG TPA: hypothetical protein VLK78_03525 [Candidatus Angelobacter sp.]|nr:hypothetical protein [Candidatus Angelobacter sp.]
MLRWAPEPIGERMVDIVLSLNSFVQEHYGQEVATASYSSVKPTLRTLDDIQNKIEEVDQAINSIPGHKGRYLKSVTNSFRYFALSLQGDDIPYDTLIANIQELPTEIISEEKFGTLKDSVEKGLADLGYKGSLKEKATQWISDTVIKPEDVVSVAKGFRDLSKVGTLGRVIDLPEEDGLDDIQSIRGVFWSGYSKYQGNFRGKLTFNIDRPWTEPILAQIMTHEGYPGHQAFYCRWDWQYQKGEWPIEAAYYLIGSTTNALFEGGPETALHFLGWDDNKDSTSNFDAKAKAQYRLARDYLDMQRIAQTNACTLYNLHGESKEAVIQHMMGNAFMNEVEATNTFRFFSDPIQKLYYPCYYYGRWMVGDAYDEVPVNKREDFFKILYDTPHSTLTFVDAISELTGKPFVPFTLPRAAY